MNSWLKSIPDDTFISDINLAGTHNSCARFVRVKYITKCQNKSLKEQLNMGIRFFDIRLEKDGDTLKTVHAVLDCYTDKKMKEKLLFSDVLSQCEEFLNKNPSEFIIICAKRDDGESDNATSDKFHTELSEKPDILYTKNSIPRLHDVRGKIILFSRFAENKKSDFFKNEKWGINACEWDHSGTVTDSAYSILNFRETETDKKTGVLVLQDKYKMGAGAKWKKAVLPTLNANFATKDVVLNFFSAASIYRSPKNSAKYIFKRFKDLPLQKNKKIGWIILDYPTEEAVRKITETNFS